MEDLVQLELYETLIDLQADVRRRIYMPAPFVYWHIAKVQRVLEDAKSNKRSSFANLYVDESAWPAYVQSLPGLISQIESQNERCATSWAKIKITGQDEEFIRDRDELFYLFDRLRLADRVYERLAREIEKPRVRKMHWIAVAGGDEMKELYDIESVLRMSKSEYSANDAALSLLALRLDELRTKAIAPHQSWAAKIAELDYPGNEAAIAGALKGLRHSINYYDCRRGYKFRTYAKWWVKEHASRAVRDGQES